MQKDNVQNENPNVLVNVFKSEKPIDSQLPIVFKSGYTFETFETKCQCCSATLTGDLVRGSLFKIEGNSRFDYWATESINSENKNEGFNKIMVDAVGYCPQCCSYTPCQIHVDDKGLTPEEAEERERQFQIQQKRKGKSFFGLNVETTSKAKSMKSKRDQEAVEAKKRAEEQLRLQENNEKAKKAEKKPTPLKGLIERDEPSTVGMIGENMRDMNEVVRQHQQEAIQKNSKAAQAFNIAASNTETVIVKEPRLETTRELNNNTGKTTKVEAKVEPVSAISQKLHDVINKDIAEDNNEKLLTRRAKEQAEKMKMRPAKKAVVAEDTESSHNIFLRGNRQSVEPQEPVLEMDEPLVRQRDTSGYVKKSRPEKKKYVQSSGSMTERMSTSLRNLVGIFGDVLKVLQEKRDSKKNDILKNYKYVKPTGNGRSSAADRLKALRDENAEFTHQKPVKAKVKKHNHDSFK